MNTQQGSSAGLNTVNYVIFLNISDSAVSACEELPGSQIQSDRSSPPLRPGDGEKLLSIALNHPETEGRVPAGLRSCSVLVACKPLGLWGRSPPSSGPDRATCRCLGERCRAQAVSLRSGG